MDVNEEVLYSLQKSLNKVAGDLAKHLFECGPYYHLEHGDKGFMPAMEDYDFLNMQAKYLNKRIAYLKANPFETV